MSVNIQTSDGLVKIAGTPTIDTSFSNISKNPVQNNVITQKFEQIDSQIRTQNSNLTQLEYSDIAGGKNILDITQNYKRYSDGVLSVSGNKVTITGQWYCYYIIDVEENTDYFISFNIDSSTTNADCAVYNEDVSTLIMPGVVNKSFNSGNNTKIAVLFYSGTYDSGTTVYSNIQIEKGTQATEYEPYIPSVKMLADEVNQQKNDLIYEDITVGSMSYTYLHKNSVRIPIKTGYEVISAVIIEASGDYTHFLVSASQEYASIFNFYNETIFISFKIRVYYKRISYQTK